MTIVYDKSFEGFLTLIYKVYYEKLRPQFIKTQMPQSLFSDDIINIETDLELAQKVLKALKEKFTKQNFERILNIFMCDTKEFELYLLEYIMLGFKEQKQLNNINIEAVRYIDTLEKELFRDVHLMYGFTRFEELEDGTLYAKIDNKFNIVYFLGKHFIKRLGDQNFIIHDIKRELAFLKSGEQKSVQKVSSFDIPSYSQDEQKFKKLWSSFFNSVAIESRANKKLQQNMVPLIYRAYMTEFTAEE